MADAVNLSDTRKQDKYANGAGTVAQDDWKRVPMSAKIR